MTNDEARALGLVALLFLLAAAARFHGTMRADAAIDAALLDADSLGDVAEERTRENDERTRPLEPGERIDVNIAGAVQLDRLPGVGPSLADEIIRDREANGLFGAVAELDRVSGIGPATLAKISPYARTAAGAGGRAGAGDASARRAGTRSSRERRPVASPSRGRAVSPAPAPAPAAVDLNSATTADLEKLPGIGPALAARIVAYRDSVGGFRTVDELEAIRGIGPVLTERLRMFVKVEF